MKGIRSVSRSFSIAANAGDCLGIGSRAETSFAARPVPIVIDFGLAKAIVQPLTELTLHTGHGILLGTPLYKSPEQAEHNNLDVDTRTDIYSLGVILYEVLTGSTPLEKQHFANAALQEILRLINEVEHPKLSTRLTESLTLPSHLDSILDPERFGPVRIIPRLGGARYQQVAFAAIQSSNSVATLLISRICGSVTSIARLSNRMAFILW